MSFDLLSQDPAATAARAAIGFLIALLLFKVAKKRFLRRGTPLDTLLVVIVGAVLGRGITDGDHFVGSIAGAVVLVGLHYLFAAVAFFVPALSDLIEGHPRTLVVDGQLDRGQSRASLVGQDEIKEAMRLRYGLDDLALVREARQERSGEISIILSSATPPRAAKSPATGV